MAPFLPIKDMKVSFSGPAVKGMLFSLESGILVEEVWPNKSIGEIRNNVMGISRRIFMMSLLGLD